MSHSCNSRCWRVLPVSCTNYSKLRRSGIFSVLVSRTSPFYLYISTDYLVLTVWYKRIVYLIVAVIKIIFLLFWRRNILCSIKDGGVSKNVKEYPSPHPNTSTWCWEYSRPSCFSLDSTFKRYNSTKSHLGGQYPTVMFKNEVTRLKNNVIWFYKYTVKNKKFTLGCVKIALVHCCRRDNSRAHQSGFRAGRVEEGGTRTQVENSRYLDHLGY